MKKSLGAHQNRGLRGFLSSGGDANYCDAFVLDTLMGQGLDAFLLVSDMHLIDKLVLCQWEDPGRRGSEAVREDRA